MIRPKPANLPDYSPNPEGIATNDYDPAVIDSSANRLRGIAERYRTLVVLIPSRALWLGNSRSRAVEDRVHTAFIVALQRRGIDVLDLQPVLEAQLAPLSYHFANDGQFHALALSARNAAQLASPIQLPPGTYPATTEIAITLDPKAVLR